MKFNVFYHRSKKGDDYIHEASFDTFDRAIRYAEWKFSKIFVARIPVLEWDDTDKILLKLRGTTIYTIERIP